MLSDDVVIRHCSLSNTFRKYMGGGGTVIIAPVKPRILCGHVGS